MLAVWEIGRNVLAGRLTGFTVVGEEIVEADHSVGADAVKDVSQVGERIDVEPFAGLDEAGESRGGLSAVVAPEKEPVSWSDCGSRQAFLGAFAVGLEVTILGRGQGLNGNCLSMAVLEAPSRDVLAPLRVIISVL
jgi:hypothetical protein